MAQDQARKSGRTLKPSSLTRARTDKKSDGKQGRDGQRVAVAEGKQPDAGAGDKGEEGDCYGGRGLGS